MILRNPVHIVGRTGIKMEQKAVKGLVNDIFMRPFDTS